MNCGDVRTEVSALFPDASGDALPETLQRHLAQCRACRAWSDDLISLRVAVGEIPGTAGPDPGYWASLVPRIRSRMTSEGSRSRSLPGHTAFALPGAAVFIFFLWFLTVMPPQEADLDRAVTTLSGTELYELQLVNKNTGLLDVHDAGQTSGEGYSISDLLSELIADEPFTTYFTALDPDEVLLAMNDTEFREFVDILEKKQ